MNEDGVRVTRIDWLTAIPSLRLCDAVRCAVSPRALIPAAFFLFLYLHWRSTSLLQPWFESCFPTYSADGSSGLSRSALQLSHLLDSFRANVRLFGGGTLLESSESFISLAALMLIFGFCAIPVMRFAGSQICSASSSGLLAGVKLSLQSWKAILISSLLSLVLLILLSTAYRILCWIGSVTFESLTSLVSLLYIVGCLVLGSGWLLSLAAIAIDRCDGAEALSRGISYVLSRWQRVIIYTLAGFVLIEITNTLF